MHELTIERPGADGERRPVRAALTAGGSPADGVAIPGAPAAAIRLVPCPAGVVVEASAPGVRVAGRPVPPGARRLLRPGERAEACGAVLALRRTEPGSPATRIAAASLLGDAAAGAAPIAGARLVVLTGPCAGARHALGPDQTLGRGRAARVRIPDARASRAHARIRVVEGGVTIEDLGSKNGLLVGGVRVDGRPRPLRPGDEITLGETSLALDDPWAAAPPAAQPEPPAARSPAAGSARAAAAAALLAICALALALAAP